MTPDETREFLTEMFGQIGERFDGVEQRFDGVDKRFDRVDERMDQIEHKVDQRFEELTVVTNSLIDAVADINKRMG
ncbi:hypothetical protein [Candidatus Poriferisodalis sp.]|uniref:hypothetical protein n=1 Tax=Candidatus Poriferisodalis sp. TaxID=3101277 RepID=UPI003B5243D0